MSCIRPGQTARVRREVARAECARELRTTLERHGISQDALSAFVGTSDTRVRKWCDPESPETPGVADLVLFPREVVVDLLSWALSVWCERIAFSPVVGAFGATLDEATQNLLGTLEKHERGISSLHRYVEAHR